MEHPYYTAPTKTEKENVTEVHLYEVVGQRTVENAAGKRGNLASGTGHGATIRYVVFRDVVTEQEQTVASTSELLQVFKPVVEMKTATERLIEWYALDQDKQAWRGTLRDIRDLPFA